MYEVHARIFLQVLNAWCRKWEADGTSYWERQNAEFDKKKYSEKMGYVKSLFVLVSLRDAMGTLVMSQTNTVL